MMRGGHPVDGNSHHVFTFFKMNPSLIKWISLCNLQQLIVPIKYTVVGQVHLVVASPLHVLSVLHVPEPVHGPGHVDAIQDCLLHAVPGEKSRGPKIKWWRWKSDFISPDLEIGSIQAMSRGCVASWRYLSNFACSTFIARLVLQISLIIIYHHQISSIYFCSPRNRNLFSTCH